MEKLERDKQEKERKDKLERERQEKARREKLEKGDRVVIDEFRGRDGTTRRVIREPSGDLRVENQEGRIIHRYGRDRTKTEIRRDHKHDPTRDFPLDPEREREQTRDRVVDEFRGRDGTTRRVIREPSGDLRVENQEGRIIHRYGRDRTKTEIRRDHQHDPARDPWPEWGDPR